MNPIWVCGAVTHLNRHSDVTIEAMPDYIKIVAEPSCRVVF
jgi:hypothetical protein